MNNLYPLKFETIFKDKIWGGNKIKTILHKDYTPLPNCGETWELSAVRGNISVVENGSLKGEPLDKLLEQFGEEILGGKVVAAFGHEFPLLIKFIDAKEDLSVQVHPDDRLAAQRHGGKGKTEMWYIFQADEGASLISGFNRPVDKNSYLEYVEKGELDKILNRVEVEKGDVFYIPAGRIHTIGQGIMLAEIQQTSDITYRIYDFNRTDAAGNKRELHTEQAVDALDYAFYESYKTPYKPKMNDRVSLVQSPYFTTNKFNIDEPKVIDYSDLDSFVIFIFTGGKGKIKDDQGNEQEFRLGAVYLVPAAIPAVEIIPEGEAEFLEVYLV